MTLIRQLAAEFIGTFWLVFAGIGSAIFALKYLTLGTGGAREFGVNLGIGWLGVAFAVGLTVMTMCFAVGHISGGHFNPAVSLGLAFGGRFSFAKLIPYWFAQVLGGAAAGGVLYLVAIGNVNFVFDGGFGCNGYGAHSPTQAPLYPCAIMEGILTMMFVVIIMGSTDKRAAGAFAPLAIGLGLTLIHLVGIPFTGLSVNPARSTGTALVMQGLSFDQLSWPMQQLWLFWAAPLGGGLLGGLLYRFLLESDPETT
jgi:aquaporin Z